MTNKDSEKNPLMISVPPERESTTASDRFSGFVMAHLTVSILLISFSPFELAVLSALPLIWMWWFVPALMMGIYFPLGVFTAWMGNWTIPENSKEKFMAIIRPTAVAWTWVGVVLWSVTLDGDAAMAALPMIFFISIIFAAPSSVFVLFCGIESFSQIFWTGLIAGVLPPLLFALGSFWWSQHREKREKMGRVLPLKEPDGETKTSI